MTSSGATVFTVGHSTRSLEDFIEALKAHGVQCVVDVRRFPASRRYPHFNRDALGPEMARRGIDYLWLPELGGRRAPNPESRNTRWRNLSFRGYADYMETAPFIDAMERVSALAATRTIALMCAEAVWWECHRAMIADYLMACGTPVRHIVDARKTEPHRYTEPARVVEGRLSYAEERLI